MSSVFSDLKIYPLKTKAGKLLGNGQVTIGGHVSVKFTILEGGQNNVFAALPSQMGKEKDENGKAKYFPQVWIPEKTTYEEFQTLVRKEFENVTGGAVQATTAQDTAGEDNQFSDDAPF